MWRLKSAKLWTSRPQQPRAAANCIHPAGRREPLAQVPEGQPEEQSQSGTKSALRPRGRFPREPPRSRCGRGPNGSRSESSGSGGKPSQNCPGRRRARDDRGESEESLGPRPAGRPIPLPADLARPPSSPSARRCGAAPSRRTAARRQGSLPPPTRAVTLRACRGPHQKTSAAANRTSTKKEIKPPREPESSREAIGIRMTQAEQPPTRNACETPAKRSPPKAESTFPSARRNGCG